MPVGDSENYRLSADDIGELRERITQLTALIGSLRDIAPTEDAATFCESVAVAWQGRTSTAPLAQTLGTVVVMEVLQHIMDRRFHLLLDETASRNDVQIMLTTTLEAARQEYERWAANDLPSDAEMTQRITQRKAAQKRLKAAIEEKHASEAKATPTPPQADPPPNMTTSAPRNPMANLTDDEQTLLKCVEHGVPFFGSNAIIRGRVIREIALGDLVEKSNPNGVNIAGAHIKDAIILGNVSSPVALHFKTCTFDKTIHVRGAQLPLLRFEHCTFRPGWGEAIAAESLQLSGAFSVHDCVIEVRKANTAIELDNATIGSHLSLQRTSIINPDGQCISGDRAKIRSNLTLSGVVAKSGKAGLGAVRFSIAEVGGRINLTEGTTIDALGGPAIMLDGIKVGEDVHAVGVNVEAAKAKDGTFRINGADINGAFTISASEFVNEGSAAVLCDRLRVRGSVMIGPEARITGTGGQGALRLMGARVDGSVSFSNALVTNTTGPAIAAETITVDGHLHLNGGLKVAGTGEDGVIRLGGARVGRRLQADDAETASATGSLVLDLGDATVGRLQLSPHFVRGDSHWLNVDRLTYTSLPMGATRGDWVDLLRLKTATYSPQAWRHLADAFRDAGHDNDARRILFAQQRDRADRTLRPSNRPGENAFRLWLQRSWLTVLRITIGYGYQVGRALAWLTAIAVLSIALGLAAGSIEYRDQRLAATKMSAAAHPVPCSSIEQVGLGLSIGLPLFKLATPDSCRLDSSNAVGQTLTAIGWLLQLLSWVFATLFIAGFTKVIRVN
ncbi:hypothetical protein ABQF35_11160 [Mycobacterium syngnathidarum]